MDCINQILKFYDRNVDENLNNIDKLKGIWLSNILIKIMNRFNEKNINSIELKNCFILLLNLFSNNDNPDHFHGKGRDRTELSGGEKRIYLNILKDEFMRN